ncbi:MAG: AAA family ATPase [Candidatus Bathyarchaeia archaeon]
MGIKEIKVTNFKSFKNMEIKLGNFTVLIGANASGKSNFVQIFKFLKDLAISGLDNAISMQGGVEYLRNINIGTSEDFSMQITCDHEFGFGVDRWRKGWIGVKACEGTYEFALRFRKKKTEFEIAKDVLSLKCKSVKLVGVEKGEIEEKEEIGEGEIIISRDNKKIKIDIRGSISPSIDKIVPFLREELIPPRMLLIQMPYTFTFGFRDILSNISIYDFDPKLPKKATPITGKAELEEDGSNLSIILKNLVEDTKNKRRLFNLIKDLLPFISDLDVEKFADKSLLFKLKEAYSGKQYIPASLISDGTINITALIIALFFEKKPLIIIEEPERNIHPHLISRIIDMMKDASKEKQIIVTTHNPEVVKYAGLDNLLLISRDQNGFSIVSKPSDEEKVKTFLMNEIGIEELFVQNLLGA